MVKASKPQMSRAANRGFSATKLAASNATANGVADFQQRE